MFRIICTICSQTWDYSDSVPLSAVMYKNLPACTLCLDTITRIRADVYKEYFAQGDVARDTIAMDNTIKIRVKSFTDWKQGLIQTKPDPLWIITKAPWEEDDDG